MATTDAPLGRRVAWRPRRVLAFMLMFLLVVFVLPAGASLAWWSFVERPMSWRTADWSSAAILPPPTRGGEAAVYLLAARTGGLKGALSTHSWMVWKEAGAQEYTRYDKLGWGVPVRRNGYPADGRWYSNVPRIVHSVTGEEAGRLIPLLEAAVEAYPYAERGGYTIWPGPNSNSFIAHLLREVPQFGAVLPSNATGRDFAPGPFAIDWSADGQDFHLTLGGYAGFAIGRVTGVELHFMGAVAGIDPFRRVLKIPGFGDVALFAED